ncbi:MAG TPA: SidE phosphodiesterase domain-containing protein, partial [Myxococcota bacterium]|nr:SidE phosphodiesterase domain-containing protein [Myxococcota bacterium]
ARNVAGLAQPAPATAAKVATPPPVPTDLSAEATPTYFMIAAVPRAGFAGRITVPIAECEHLRPENGALLTEEGLAALFALANRHTLNKPYPVQRRHLRIDGAVIYRPNHNGTHSARQVRFIEALLDLLAKQGTAEIAQVVAGLTPEELQSAKLAAYFLRAGRVDESSHKEPWPDDYYTRSAQIYEAYARQVGVDAETLAWTFELIVNSCKPDKAGDGSPKTQLLHALLTTAHELDLVRCFSAHGQERITRSTVERLQPLLVGQDEASAVDVTAQLYGFATRLCLATGSRIRIRGDACTDSALYAACSLDGRHCWEVVCAEPLPVWPHRPKD